MKVMEGWWWVSLWVSNMCVCMYRWVSESVSDDVSLVQIKYISK
jgi:hypothetical protein